jgi:hypothetical protein
MKLCCLVNPLYCCRKCPKAWCDKDWDKYIERDRSDIAFTRWRDNYVFACPDCKSRLRNAVTKKYL